MKRNAMLRLFVLALGVVAIFVGINVYLASKYSARIEIDYAPLSATFRIDGRKQKPGLVRVKPGKHSIAVELDGFLGEKVSVVVAKSKIVYVGYALQSSSPKTADWYTKHPEDARIAERISGRNIDVAAEKTLSLEPFIKELPFVGPGFSYQIGVGATDKNGKPAIVIHAQSDEALADAEQWIRSMGYNPDKMNLVINPDQIGDGD